MFKRFRHIFFLNHFSSNEKRKKVHTYPKHEKNGKLKGNKKQI